MGNHAHLVSTNDTSYAQYYDFDNNSVTDDSAYLLQKYALPPFWLALFEEKDLQTEKMREVISNDETYKYDACFFLTDKQSALANFAKHKPALIQRFGSNIAILAEQFIKYMDDGIGQNILLDMDEFRAMDDVNTDLFMREILYSHRVIMQPDLPNPDDSLVKQGDKFQLGVYLGYLRYANGEKPENTYEYVGTGAGEKTPWEIQIDENDIDPLAIEKPKKVKVEEVQKQHDNNKKDGFSISGFFKKLLGK